MLRGGLVRCNGAGSEGQGSAKAACPSGEKEAAIHRGAELSVGEVLRAGSGSEVRDSEAAVVRESGGKAETGVGSERGLYQSGIN